MSAKKKMHLKMRNRPKPIEKGQNGPYSDIGKSLGEAKIEVFAFVKTQRAKTYSSVGTNTQKFSTCMCIRPNVYLYFLGKPLFLRYFTYFVNFSYLLKQLPKPLEGIDHTLIVGPCSYSIRYMVYGA